jgi:hypothetical protein
VHDETDETIARIAAALRPLPEVDAAQKARVLVAVAAERERAREQRASGARGWRIAGALGVLAAAGLVAAAWLSGFGPGERAVASVPPVSAPTPGGPGRASVDARLARDANAAGLSTVQVVLRAPSAHRVSVVGDFNEWDARADSMTRDPLSGLWSHSLALRPGRHVYAFIVDDSMWVRDPRGAATPDEDFGRPGSVLLVGHP